LAALAASSPSSSDAHCHSFGRGCTCRSYSNEVSPGLNTFRTVFRDNLQVAGDLLYLLTLDEVLAPYPRNHLHDQHPQPPASFQSRQRNSPTYGGSILDADPPARFAEPLRAFLCLG